MVLSKRAKIVYLALFTGAIIFTIFGIVILFQAYNNTNYPTDLRNGQTLVYAYSASYSGDDVGGTYIADDARLSISIINIGPNYVNISVTNNWTFNYVVYSSFNYSLISTTHVNFPFFIQRDDAYARFSISVDMTSMPTGEFFGWASNPRYFKIGYTVGDYFINSKQIVGTPARTFGTYELIKHEIQVIDDILIENKTTIYVEQVTGVIVQSKYYSIIKNLTSNADLYKESETAKLVGTTTYTFPILSGMVLFLNLADPIILFLEQYFIVIVLIIAIILVVFLWKKSSGFRKD